MSEGADAARVPKRTDMVEIVASVPARHDTIVAMEKLAAEFGTWSFFTHKTRDAVVDYARRNPRIVAETEDDVLVVLVERERAEDIFQVMVDALKIDRPGGGGITMTRVVRATTLVTGPIPKRDEDAEGEAGSQSMPATGTDLGPETDRGDS